MEHQYYLYLEQLVLLPDYVMVYSFECRHLHLDLLKQVYVGGIRSTFGLILNGGNMKFEEKKYIIGNLTSIFMNLRCCNKKNL